LAQPVEPSAADSSLSWLLTGEDKEILADLVSIALGRHDEQAVATARSRLAAAQGDAASLGVAALRLAILLVAGDEVTAAQITEAKDLLVKARGALQGEARGCAGLVETYVLLKIASPEDSLAALKRAGPDLPATDLHRRLFAHLRAQIASAGGGAGAEAAMRDLIAAREAPSYPFVPFPRGPGWGLVRAAHLMAMEARYQGMWVPLPAEALELTVGQSFRSDLDRALATHTVESEQVWAAFRGYLGFLDAHHRPAGALVAVKEMSALQGSMASPDRRIWLHEKWARYALQVGDAASARDHLAAARKEIEFAETTVPGRIKKELALADEVDLPESPELAIEAFERVDVLARRLPNAEERLAMRTQALAAQLSRHARLADLRAVTAVYEEALPVAQELDAHPELAQGRRFHAERLEAELLDALARVPARWAEAEARLKALLSRMDGVVPLWRRPAEEVLTAGAEARDVGNASSIEEHLRRVSAAEVQERALPVLGRLLLNLGKWAEAKAALTQALSLDYHHNTVCGSPDQLEFSQGLALAARHLSDPAGESLQLNEWSNCAADADRASRAAAGPLPVRARALADQGDLYAAEYLLRRAIHILEAQRQPADLALASARLDLARLILGQRRAREELENTLAAASILAAADSPTAQWRELALDAIDLLSTGRPSDEAAEAALALMQRVPVNHASAALQAFAARSALRDPGLASLVQRRIELQRQHAVLDLQFQEAFATASAAANTARRDALLQDLDAVERELRRSAGRIDSFAGYSDLVVGRAVPWRELGAAENGLLEEGEALVVFTQATEHLFAAVIRRGAIHLVRLDLAAANAASMVRLLRATLDLHDGVDPEHLPAYDVATAAELYSRIWRPLEGDLAGVSRALVVPHGPLESLPLEVLVRTSKGPGLDQQEWLDQAVAIAYLPSVSSLRAMRTGVAPSRATRPLLAFAAPDLAGAGAELKADGSFKSYFGMGGGLRANLACELPPLPQTARLVTDMATALHADLADVYLGQRATERQLRALQAAGALEHFRVIAFATHGLVAGELPAQLDAEPALVLTPPPGCRSESAESDGLLTASEIAGLSLDAEWVILAACNTAAPDGTPGAEPLSGLARAFFYAGSRSLLVSHWSVDPEATSALISSLFAPGETQSRAARLQRARASLRRPVGPETSRFHPALWGGFVLVGDGR
ncbi:MAG TPA: CHAT domain-containing protein, partial [Thermoanaerobaculia bacterium]|nr:CHAT domain-containing protein [Thermoanaerobaculia bacterium]